MSATEPSSTNRPSTGKRRNPMAQRRQQAIAAASATVAGQLGEANQWGIARLMEIFGVEFVARIAADARERYDAPQMLDSQPQPNGTPVITSKGVQRTPGGVFFYRQGKGLVLSKQNYRIEIAGSGTMGTES